MARLVPVFLALLSGLFFTACQTETQAPTTLLTRQSVDLNQGWLFHAGDTDDALRASELTPGAWEPVSLPHTWNARDGQDGGDNYRRGAGWYRRHFTPDTALLGRRLVLQFDGANLATEAFVNGKRVGSHLGGFARFRFDVTDYLIPGRDNVLAVRVDNGPQAAAPISADFTFFGGLYRGVSLLVTDPIHVETLDHASPGIFLSQGTIDATRAQVSCRVQLSNQGPTGGTIEVKAVVADAKGQVIAGQSSQLQLPSGAKSETSIPLSIANPHLWNGVEDPYLYTVTVEVWNAGRLRDRLSQPLGLRTLRFDAATGFSLNGKTIQLHGVNRHQDRLDKGWAISDDEEAEDFALIREMGANAIRTSHYQQAQSWYDRCDRAGIAVWTEIPFVNEGNAAPGFAENASEQLRELIRQNYNHPSIIVWGIANELNDKSSIPVLRTLAPIVRQEDPGRPSTYASNHGADDERNGISEVIGFTRYYGWYTGEFPALGGFLDEVHAKYPKSAIAISEYGAGASILHQEQNPLKRATTGKFHPEQYQALYHEACWPQLRDRPYVWGAFIWAMFDFASEWRNEGDQPGRNDKGLVTIDRKHRKDAFFYYKANWSKEPVLHITSARHQLRYAPGTEVKVYSNASMVELFINGRSLGIQPGSNGVFLWKNILLTRGSNLIEVRALRQGELLKDSCTWILDPEKAARPPAP